MPSIFITAANANGFAIGSTQSVTDAVALTLIGQGLAINPDTMRPLQATPQEIQKQLAIANANITTPSAAVQRVQAIRPKLASIGNSINDRNRLGETSNGYYSAWGFLTWIHAASGAAFDRCRSKGIVWNANENMDQLGCYGAPGCTIGSSGPQSILARIGEVLNNLIDVPDIIYLSALFENDLAVAQSRPSAEIIYNGQKAIQLCRSTFPNAILIIATPGPSTNYNTGAVHANVAAVSAWVQGLPLTDSHILCELNTSLILAGTADQPNPSYMSDGVVHQNERGALVRAKSFVAQLGYLFANPLQVSQTSAGTYGNNPDFALTGNPGSGTAPVFTGYDAYFDTNFAATVVQNPSGQGITFTLNSVGAVSSGNGVSMASDAQVVTIVPNQAYAAVVKMKVVNPANLFMLNVLCLPSVGGPFGMWVQGTFAAAHPEGLSDIFKAGDTYTLVSPPVLPGAGATTIFSSAKVQCTSSTPATVGANSPSVQLAVQTVVAAFSAQPAAPTIGASPWTYTNKSNGQQQAFVSGGTVSLIQFTRDAGTTYFAASATVLLSPGDQLRLTYSVAPTFNVVQMS
jgi:hypothetical protein